MVIAFHFVLISPLYWIAVTEAFNLRWTKFSVLWFVVNTTILVLLIIDIGVAAQCLRRIRLLTRSTDFWVVYFLDGKGWDELTSIAKDASTKVLALRQRAAQFPHIKSAVEKRLRTHGFESSLALVAEIEQCERARSHAAADAARREVYRVRQATELLQKGVAVGIPEETMRKHVSNSLAEARAAIARKEGENLFLVRAGNASCKSYVQLLVQNAQFSEAQRYVVQAEALIERAMELDIEKPVRQDIANRGLTRAQELVAEAQRKRDIDFLRTTFEARIRMMRPGHQYDGQQRLQTLMEKYEYGSRAFRKARHDLDQYLPR